MLTVEITPRGADGASGSRLSLTVEDEHGAVQLVHVDCPGGVITLDSLDAFLSRVTHTLWALVHRNLSVQYPLDFRADEPFDTSHERGEVVYRDEDSPF